MWGHLGAPMKSILRRGVGTGSATAAATPWPTLTVGGARRRRWRWGMRRSGGTRHMTFGPAFTIATVAAIAAAAGTKALPPPGQPAPTLLGVTPALFGGGHDLVHEGIVVGPLDGNLLADELLDGFDPQRARLIHHADRLAAGAGARRAADAVDVILGVVGQVPVHDVG